MRQFVVINLIMGNLFIHPLNPSSCTRDIFSRSKSHKYEAPHQHHDFLCMLLCYVNHDDNLIKVSQSFIYGFKPLIRCKTWHSWCSLMSRLLAVECNSSFLLLYPLSLSSCCSIYIYFKAIGTSWWRWWW